MERLFDQHSFLFTGLGDRENGSWFYSTKRRIKCDTSIFLILFMAWSKLVC